MPTVTQPASIMNYATTICTDSDRPNGDYVVVAHGATGYAPTVHCSPGTTYAGACELVRAKLTGQHEDMTSGAMAQAQQNGMSATVSFTVVSCEFKGGPVDMHAYVADGPHELKISQQTTVQINLGPHERFIQRATAQTSMGPPCCEIM